MDDQKDVLMTTSEEQPSGDLPPVATVDAVTMDVEMTKAESPQKETPTEQPINDANADSHAVITGRHN